MSEKETKINVEKKIPVKDEQKFTNRLAKEKSPYLLQHAHNPVDWYPWGDEAFEHARKEDKPIFLSVGYSTCHWCHVMEHESFENEDIAAIMNENYVNIKVDREERPDVDKIYMTYVQATEGGGGWPMSIFLTPDLDPILGGTYFPPQDQFGRPGFPRILRRISEMWKTKKKDIQNQAKNISVQLKEHIGNTKQITTNTIETVTEKAIAIGYSQISSSFDSDQGGFDKAPKFPRPVVMDFLFRIYDRGQETKASPTDKSQGKEALRMCLKTLDMMGKGGIHDHLDGGFHRYSVTHDWHIPHYEKMLYDQAQIAISYLDAYQSTHDEKYATLARDVMDYTSGPIITSEEGGLYSAEDADSIPPPHKSKAPKQKKLEGAFYVWEKKEIDSLLGKEKAPIFNFMFGVKPTGNAAPGADPHGELAGQNTLIQRYEIKDVAKKFEKSTEEIEEIVNESKKILNEERKKRPRPHLDDKIITAWNGLMITAYARGYEVLGDEKYLKAAERAALFIKKNLYDETKKTLIRNYREGASKTGGFAEDYAFLIHGLIGLYEASLNLSWIEWALELQNTQNKLFLAKDGGYYNVIEGDKSLLFRSKEDYDGAEPSYNSVAAINLLRFHYLLDKSDFQKLAQQTILAFRDRLVKAPIALPLLAVAADLNARSPTQIYIVGDPKSKEVKEFLKIVHSKYIPNKVILLCDEKGKSFFGDHVKDMTQKNDKPTIYVCHDFVCSLPTNDPKELAKTLRIESSL